MKNKKEFLEVFWEIFDGVFFIFILSGILMYIVLFIAILKGTL